MHRAGDPRQRFCFATSCEVALRGGLTEPTVSPGRRDVIQEGLHPDYWGQVAMRNCLRQLWNNGGVLNAAVGSYWHCNTRALEPEWPRLTERATRDAHERPRIEVEERHDGTHLRAEVDRARQMHSLSGGFSVFAEGELAQREAALRWIDAG